MEAIIHNIQPSSVSKNTPQSLECPICFSNETEIQLLEITPCSHKFCKPSLSEYLVTQISELKVLKVKCPDTNCPCLLKKQIFQEVLDNSSFQKYQKVVLQKISYRKLNARFCPKPGCSKPYAPSTDSSFTECSCKTRICNFCNDFWHEGKNCFEASNTEFQQYAKENQLKLCLMCKTVVARVEGCTHITCPICDYEWCWLCGNEYTHQHNLQCKRKWSPVPPSTLLRENDTCSQTKMILSKITIFLILTPLKILFWPFFMLNFPAGNLMTNLSLIKKFHLILLLAVNVLYNCIWLGLTLLIIESSELLLPFGVCIFFVLILPWVFYSFIKGPEAKKKNKRWLTGDSSVFVYTSAHRPTAVDNNSNGSYAIQVNTQ